MTSIYQLPLPMVSPRRRGSKEEEFFGICAVHGKMSAYCLMSPYIKPGTKKALAWKARGIRKVVDVRNGWSEDVHAKIRIRNRVQLKRPICRHCREAGNLHVPKRVRPGIGPTTIESRLLCPEQYLWAHDPKLRHHLKMSEAMAVGSIAHKAIAEYQIKGVLTKDGRQGVEALVNLAVTNPRAVGLLHPLPDTSVGALIRIKERVYRLVRTGIESGYIKTLADLNRDPRLIYAEVEMPVKVLFSDMAKELIGGQTTAKFDSTLIGQLDRFLVYLLTPNRIGIHIRDWKTGEKIPGQNELARYTQALQMRAYGAWALWVARSSWEKFPEVEIVLDHLFLTETEAHLQRVQFDPAATSETLADLQTYLEDEFEAKAYGRRAGWQRMAHDKYPPREGPHCYSCLAFKLCTATREQSTGSYIDDLLPPRKQIPARQNKAITL